MRVSSGAGELLRRFRRNGPYCQSEQLACAAIKAMWDHENTVAMTVAIEHQHTVGSEVQQAVSSVVGNVQ